MNKAEILNRLREKIKNQKSGGFTRDPNEFRVDQEKLNAKYKFFVLPGVESGPKPMEDFYIVNGSHWINRRPNGCPRVTDKQECPVCKAGFDLMNDAKENGMDKEHVSKIAKTWMPNNRYTMNIYFPDIDSNPEELRGTVKFWHAPKTVYDMMEACILSDNKGDEDDPQAHGIFYYYDDDSSDEPIPGGFLFQLSLSKKSGGGKAYVSYESSKFLYGKGSMPLASKGGKPDSAKIAKIMGMRHDLWSKIESRNVSALKKIVEDLANSDGSDDSDGEFKKVESRPATPAVQVEKSKAKPKVVEPVEEEKESEEEDSVDEKDETPPPPPQKVKAAPKSVKNDDDDDDDNEELNNLLKRINKK